MIPGASPIASSPISSPLWENGGQVAEIPSVVMELVSVVPTVVKTAAIPAVKIKIAEGRSSITSSQRRPTLFQNIESGVGNVNWVNLSDAITANSTPASVTLNNQLSDYLSLFGFEFPLVDGTPVSISVEVRAKKSSGSSVSLSFAVAKDGGNFNVNTSGSSDMGSGLTTSYSNVNDSQDFVPGVITAAEIAASSLFGIGLISQNSAGGPITVDVDDVLVSITYSTGITILKSAVIGPVAMEVIAITPSAGSDSSLPVVGIEFVSVTPSTSKVAAVPAVIMEFVGVIPATAKLTTLSAVVFEFAVIAPTVTKSADITSAVIEFPFQEPTVLTSNVLPVVAFEFTSNEPLTTKQAVITPAVIEFTGVTPGTVSGNEMTPVVIEFLSVTPATAKSFTLPTVIMELIGVPVNTLMEAAVPSVKIEFIGITPISDSTVQVPSVVIAFAHRSLIGTLIYIGVNSIKGVSSSEIIGVGGVHILGID